MNVCICLHLVVTELKSRFFRISLSMVLYWIQKCVAVCKNGYTRHFQLGLRDFVRLTFVKKRGVIKNINKALITM
jgi:hypothetical protein